MGRIPPGSQVVPVLLSKWKGGFKTQEKAEKPPDFWSVIYSTSGMWMRGVRLQSGRAQVFFKKMFPIFVCLGKLGVECKGCHSNIIPPLFFYRLVTWDPRTFWKPLLIVPMLGPVWGLCLRLE